MDIIQEELFEFIYNDEITITYNKSKNEWQAIYDPEDSETNYYLLENSEQSFPLEGFLIGDCDITYDIFCDYKNIITK